MTLPRARFMREDASQNRERLSVWWPLIPVIAVALGVRLVGVDWGLPYIYDFDEPNNLTRTLTMLREGDANPHWFHYGSLMFYLYGAVIAGATGILNLFGSDLRLSGLESPEMIAAASGFLSEPTLLLTRYTSIVLSIATVVVIYLIVRKLTDSPLAAVVAAGLFALAPVAVSEGRLFSPNTLSGLLAAIALGVSLRVYTIGTSRDYLLGGVMVGLAAGAKYNAALVGICLLIAHWLRRREGKPVVSRGPLTAIYFAIGAFLVTTPFAILDAPEFLGDVGFELAHYTAGHVGSEGKAAFFVAFLTSLSLALFVLPLGFLESRYRSPMLIVVGFGVIYLITFSSFQTSFTRNLLPVLPAFCVAAGIGAAAGWERRDRLLLARPYVIRLLILGAFGLSALALLAQYRNLEDRTDASEWIAANLPLGSTVIVDAYTPWVDPTSYSVEYSGIIGERPLADSWDFLLMTPRGSGRYEAQTTAAERVMAIRSSTCLLREFPDVVEIRSQSCR